MEEGVAEWAAGRYGWAAQEGARAEVLAYGGAQRAPVWREQHERPHVVPRPSRTSLLPSFLTSAMKAPCCLLGAAALPRPPEPWGAAPRPPRARPVPRGSYTYMLCVWWVMLAVTRASAAGTDCPVRTDASDVASKAWVSPQVVEALVREVGVATPGHPYTVSAVVTRKLREYTGRSRVKKRATLTLTFRLPLAHPQNSARNSDSVDDCLVSATLRASRKYLLFLSGPKERGVPPVPVAAPELASKKLRRLVRKTVCKHCGEYLLMVTLSLTLL